MLLRAGFTAQRALVKHARDTAMVSSAASMSTTARMNPTFIPAYTLVTPGVQSGSGPATPSKPAQAPQQAGMPQVTAPAPRPTPFAISQSTGLRLVERVAARAADRTRLSLADKSLDKEASLLTGTITPGKIGDTDAEVGGGTAGARKARVQAESLARIERYMGQGKSPAARAAVRTVLARKAAELTAGSSTDPVAQLAALAARAEAEGVRLLLSREERILIKEWRKKSGTRPANPRVRAPTYDPVAASTTLQPLAVETKRLKTFVDRHRDDLADAAKAVRFPSFGGVGRAASGAATPAAAALAQASAAAPAADAPAVDAAAAPAPAAIASN